MTRWVSGFRLFAQSDSESIIGGMSFVRIITGLVWGLQPFIFGIGLYHETVLDNAFIFGSSLVYMVALFSIPYIVRHKRLSSLMQALLIVNMLLNGFGAYGLYTITYHYDDMVHFLSPALLTWGICVWFAPKQLWRPAVFAIVIGLIWEPAEYYGDQIFSTRAYGQSGQPLDTLYDIMMDSFGVWLGLGVFWLTRRPVLNWVRGWSEYPRVVL